MSIFGSLFGKKKKCFTPNPVRETLFGDIPLEQWPRKDEGFQGLPWEPFVSARKYLAAGNRADAIACWQQVLAHPGLEPRFYLQAWHFLRQQGVQPPPETAKQLLGVVVEVDMPQGLDLLAAYADYSARYYNYTGGGVVWEHPDTSLDSSIDQLLDASRHVVGQIGPWEQARPEPPPAGHARISFLTPSGLHFGQGPMDTLSRDPLGGRVIELSIVLMTGLIGKTQAG